MRRLRWPLAPAREWWAVSANRRLVCEQGHRLTLVPSPLIPSLLGSLSRSTAVLGNPLFLVKARLQAYSPQHQIGRSSFNYAGTWDGLRSIVRSDGWGGLARGVDAAMLRTAMGSSVSCAPREARRRGGGSGPRRGEAEDAATRGPDGWQSAAGGQEDVQCWPALRAARASTAQARRCASCV
jgi:hypothetical protein